MLRRCLTRWKAVVDDIWLATEAAHLHRRCATASVEETQKTYIQKISPNTKAAKTWLYEAWPKTATQGDKADVTFPLINFKREELGKIVLGGDIFNVPVRRDILHRVVRWQRAKKQQGTHKAKTRAEVRGGGRKIRPQKGLGKARQGSIRAPHWKGGGKAHGPVPRSHAHHLTRKVRRLGLKCALSAKAVENRLMIVDAIESESHKTKLFNERLTALIDGAPRVSVYMLDGAEEIEKEKNTRKASRNIPNLLLHSSSAVNVYDILRYDILVLSKAAVDDVTSYLRSKLKR